MKSTATVIGILALLAAPLAWAQNLDELDYDGFMWETNSFPPSSPGEMLHLCAVVNSISPESGLDLTTSELTMWAWNLASTGQADFGGGFIGITYVSGMIELWHDPAMNANYGTHPPNTTVPRTLVSTRLVGPSRRSMASRQATRVSKLSQGRQTRMFGISCRLATCSMG